VTERFLVTPYLSTIKVRYAEACTWYGALTFANLSDDIKLKEKLIQKADSIIYDLQEMIPPPIHVDDNVFGIVPLEVYMQNKDATHLNKGLFMSDEQFKTLSPAEYEIIPNEVRNWYKEGLSWQTRFWIDDMYMISSLQSQAFRATGDSKYLNWAARIMTAYLDTLQTENGLFYHAQDVPIYWGRGNGWVAAGMTELLRSLPQDNIYHQRIMNGYLKMMQSLLKHQDEEGMWRQIITDPESWPETSCTGMFTFAFITGVKNGWLDPEIYGPAARKAWIKLCTYLNEDFLIREVCQGTNKLNDRQYYLDRERITGDPHGQAPLLWCVSAILR
jgi:rhamnogalacturonyl hydrolase YesR